MSTHTDSQRVLTQMHSKYSHRRTASTHTDAGRVLTQMQGEYSHRRTVSTHTDAERVLTQTQNEYSHRHRARTHTDADRVLTQTSTYTDDDDGDHDLRPRDFRSSLFVHLKRDRRDATVSATVSVVWEQVRVRACSWCAYVCACTAGEYDV